MAREQEGLTERCIIAVATIDLLQTVFIDSLTVLIVSIDEKFRDNRHTQREMKIKSIYNRNKEKMYPSLESRSVFVACLLRFHHISLAGMASFTLSTYCNGLVIYLGMYVALP